MGLTPAALRVKVAWTRPTVWTLYTLDGRGLWMPNLFLDEIPLAPEKPRRVPGLACPLIPLNLAKALATKANPRRQVSRAIGWALARLQQLSAYFTEWHASPLASERQI